MRTDLKNLIFFKFKILESSFMVNVGLHVKLTEIPFHHMDNENVFIIQSCH